MISEIISCFGRSPLLKKRTVSFQNQRLGRHLVADYTIIMSRTLKVTRSHVMYDHGEWFPRVIILSSRALFSSLICIFLHVQKLSVPRTFMRSAYYKTIMRFGFCDIQNNQVLSKGDNHYLDLDYFGYHKNLIQ